MVLNSEERIVWEGEEDSFDLKAMGDGFLHFSRADILEYIKNRPPLLMIDEAYVKPGEMVYSEKLLTSEEWFFACHFPGNPMMPGVLQLETMFNSSALLIKVMDGNRDKTTNISRISNVHYRKQIKPGDRIKVVVRMNKFRRGLGFMNGKITVDNKICCEAEFVLVVLDDVVIREV